VPQLSASAQKPPAHGAAALQARQPLASATQVRVVPLKHSVSPTASQPWAQRPHAVEEAQKPSAQLDGAAKARQPLASAAQVESAPSAQTVWPELQVWSHAPHDAASPQKPDEQPVLVAQ
jgi:hypothetical protein